LCVVVAGSFPYVFGQGTLSLTLSDALRTSLRNNPQVAIAQDQVSLQKGILRQSSGQFDLNLAADGLVSHGYRPLTGYEEFLDNQYDDYFRNSAITNSSQLNLSASKLLRNGILLSPTINASRTTDNLTNRLGYEAGGIRFNVTVPLLQGMGRKVVTANEAAAARQVDAAVLNADQSVAGNFAQVAADYWNLVAAVRDVELLRESEDRAEALLSAAQSLIEADRMPRSDLSQMQSDQARRQADRVAGEQRLEEARQQLALQMGVDPNGSVALAPLDSQLPQVIPAEQIPSGPDAAAPYVRYALEQRPDLQALKKQREGYELLERAAKDGLRPQLDLQVGSGITGLSEGTDVYDFLVSPGHSVRGVDVTAGFTYRFPPARNVAGGALEQATAVAHQSKLQYEDLAHQTAVDVSTALSGLHSAALRARSMQDSLKYAQQSLDAEQERLRSGVGSTIDVITLQDRLTTAEESDLQAKLAFAQALVRLRFATSTIVAPTSQGGTVDGSVFATLPVLPDAHKEVQP
jgi:outer membrane protein